MRSKVLFTVFVFLFILFILLKKTDVALITESSANIVSVLPIVKSKARSGGVKLQDEKRPIENNSSMVAEKLVEAAPSNLYCYIKKMGLNIPLGSHVKFQYGNYKTAFSKGLYLWIRSEECPDHFYSVVHINSLGQIEKKISCTETTLTELSIESEFQFTLREAPQLSTNDVNVSISGPGRFLVYCPSSGFYLTREGSFKKNASGQLEDPYGCLAWNRGNNLSLQNGPISDIPNTMIDSKGCFENSEQCLAIIDPKNYSLSQFNWVDKNHLYFDFYPHPISPPDESKIYSGLIEDLDDPNRSLTGIEEWSEVPSLDDVPTCDLASESASYH